MSEDFKNNRPQVRPESPVSEVRERMEASRSASKMPWVILGLVVVILVVLGVVFRGQLFGGKMNAAPSSAAGGKASGYQAVFLTNGQVYFGKMGQNSGDYATMSDIYYLQVIQRQPLQGTPNATSTQAAGQDITLVKLGQELHGPVDEMHISRSQILFYEDMKTDSQVVKAIQSYKANPNGTQQAPAAGIPSK